MDDSRLDATADYWDALAGKERREERLSHSLVQDRLRQLRGGKSLTDWFISNYLTHGSIQHALGVGVGAAAFELELVRRGAVRAFDLFDVSAASLEAARQTAQAYGVEDNVRFIHQDINRACFSNGTYQLVTFIHALHHLAEPRTLLLHMRDVLTADGLLLGVEEYIGPNRFDYPNNHTSLARQLFRVLDPALKAPWPELPLPNPTDVERADPTESVHSAEIVGHVEAIFPVVEVLPLEGALAHIIWWGLNYDALHETENGRNLVRLILELDTALLAAGVLPSYFVNIVARNQ